MKLNGINRIEKVLNSFTEQFGITAHFAWDGDWEAIPDLNEIHVPLLIGVNSARIFIDYVLDNYAVVMRCNCETRHYDFLLSLLHEIGHCMTEVFIERDASLTDERIRINRECSDVFIGSDRWRELNYEYFELEDESLATDWAVVYLNDHIEECVAFAERYEEAIKYFVKQNKLEDVTL